MTASDPNLDRVIHNRAAGVGLTLAAVAFILFIHFAGRIGGYCSPLGDDDSYIFAGFGCRMAGGDVLYRDMSDIKPPGLFMLYALVYLIAPAARLAIAPIESLFLLAGYYTIYRFCAEFYGKSAALCATVLAAVTISYFTVTGTAIVGFGVAEGFMVFPAAAAALFYLRGLTSNRLKPLFVAGVFLGFDTCLKQTALPLVIALVAHWTMTRGIIKRDPRGCLAGLATIFLGGCVGWAPAIAMLIAQGTLLSAVDLLTRDAGQMFGRASAWPHQWRDILPLTAPAIWAVWAIMEWAERRARRQSVALNFAPPTFLALWCACETYLLINLPLRSPHYYIIACVPFLLLSAAPVAAFARCVTTIPPRARLTVWTVAVVFSAILFKPSIDEIVPRAIAAHATYDWSLEESRFQDEINKGPIHYGRGDPFVGTLD